MKKLYASCPRCDEPKLIRTEFSRLGVILAIRNWIVCKNCDYAIQIEDFKKLLYCS